jgi:DNA-binding winged helix-turn-helix (wHTH) protein
MVSRVLSFGEFTLDMDHYQLQRGGFAVKLEDLPLRLLMLLVNRRGQLVSRREIEEELWGRDVFVDIEQGINTAIRKIRQVLRDHPEKPRYLQTVVGKGYRFIDVEVVAGGICGPSIPKPTLEELGQAILSAAGLESVLPNLAQLGSQTKEEQLDDRERSHQKAGRPRLQSGA